MTDRTDTFTRDKFLIEDVLDERLLVVFCGTALGNRSASQKEYYAHPSNKFWETLHEVGLTRDKIALRSNEYRRVREFGIGLTDLCKSSHGNDDQLPKGAFDRMALQEKIEMHGPAILAFTSKAAGKAWGGYKVEFGWQLPLNSTTRVYVLPSTSVRARRAWSKNKHHWQIVAEAAKSLAKEKNS
jgi:double-stranded uracil-DNA glycosylase